MARRKSANRFPIRKESVAVIMFFLVIWFIGIALGEPTRVLEQAIRVCLSCIGIG